jgi:hypothetical protein
VRDSNKAVPLADTRKSPFGAQFGAFLPETPRPTLGFAFSCPAGWRRSNVRPEAEGATTGPVHYHARMPPQDVPSAQSPVVPFRALSTSASEFAATLSFVPTAETVANLTVGRGVLHGRECLVAFIESRFASGAIGKAECERLASLFKVATAKAMPVALYLDSAGARVSEGLPALGAFRAMFAAAARAKQQHVPMLAMLGTNCFGGASMLAALCDQRVFQPNTRLAMSGPSILAAAAGMSALDDMFRAIAEVSIGEGARVKLDPSNSDQLPSQWAVPTPTNVRCETLDARLRAANLLARGDNAPVTRRDLALLYPDGVNVREVDGVLTGTANVDGGEIAILGSVDKRPMGAARSQRMVAALAALTTSQVHMLMDCDAHSAAVDDEKVMLSSYLAELTLSLLAARARGVDVEVIVLGKLGGGIYLALAAGCTRLSLLYGAEIQLLPGKAIAAILGEATDTRHSFEDYRVAGVADAERKIGLV